MDMKMFLSFINNESLAPIIRICTWHLLHVKKIVASTISSYLIRDFLNVVQSLNHVQLFATPSNAAHQASQSFTTSQSLLKLMSIESVMLSVSSSTPPFSSSCPESFPPSWVGSLHQEAKVLEFQYQSFQQLFITVVLLPIFFISEICPWNNRSDSIHWKL